MLKRLLKKFRNWYVIRQVTRASIPAFSDSRICRYRVTFSGRVQWVGFRLEATELARRLVLTGFCENLSDGRVLAEFQGAENRIRYLIRFMESLKRIAITEKRMEELPLLAEESGFSYR